MPMAPGLPQDEMAKAQTTGNISPTQFLIAAAEMHNSGQLSSPVPAGKPLQTGKVPKGRKHMQVVK